MNVTLRPLILEDIELLRRVRNANRDAFFDSSIISPEQQDQWWISYIQDDDQPDSVAMAIYTIFSGEEVAGFFSCRFLRQVAVGDRIYPAFEIGNLMLRSKFQGQGIMAEALSKLIPYQAFWIAQVKPNNHASLRFFEKAGFWKIYA